ncbi:MAG TPA: N-acetyltransferase [Candidatus Blautia merdavium]|uniref:N-acetyltransferase n=1 Tax=Candidatus Blautia merdavium TaxID=2838494 RepID=A0A9D2PMW5_9FIRM|nr:N-acetyltransferase [Candidatus Blautia merdavium]
MDYIELNLLEMLDTYGEDKLQAVLSCFICPQNTDVENFIQSKAITFARQRLAMTYLIYSAMDNPELVGYFTLANKFVSIDGNALSKTLQKRISKFSQYDKEFDRFLVSMPLIAQLGRNFNPSLLTSIPGQDLLAIACRKVQEAQFIIGGKAVYIECASNPKLFDFYSASQFVQFGQRERDTDEIEESPILVQMLKYFRD